MKYTFEQFDPGNPDHMGSAINVSKLSRETGTMVQYTVTEIGSHPAGVIALNDDKEFLGYLSVTEVNREQKRAKIGAFAVADEYQGNGVGTALVGEIVRIIPIELPEIDNAFAYVNDGSLNAFLANGFEISGERQPPSPTGCNTIVGLKIGEAQGDR